MGDVYLAEDTRLNRKVALKLLRNRGSLDPRAEQRFRKEAQAAAQLDHPNVCTIFEVGQEGQDTYIAMQYAEGETLGARLRRGPLPLEEALDIAQQVLDALEEAHRLGIVHRDIKPHNLMLTPRGQVKVLDFGLAKFEENRELLQELSQNPLTGPEMAVGTVPYMSPEQLKGEPTDGRTDLFSLGTVLYELLTGQRAFQAKSNPEIMSAILNENPPLLDLGPPEFPLSLRHVLRRALEKDPRQRYPSARAFREDLQLLRKALKEPSGSEPPFPSQELTRESHKANQLHLSRPKSRFRPSRKAWWIVGGLFLAASATGLGWKLLPAWRSHGMRIQSVAVLPVANTTGNPAWDYLCEGLTENLIQRLAHVPELKVIARSSVLRYKGQTPDLPALARELGVETVVIAQFAERSGEISVSLELARTLDRSHLWGERLSQTSLVELQNQLADRLCAQMGRPLGSPEAGRIRTSQEAYELYLKGRHHAEKMTPEDMGRAMVYFEQALAKDPRFPLPHLGMAKAYWNMSSTFKPSQEMVPKVRDAAHSALALDPQLGEAHTALAYATWILDQDFPSAEREYRKAIELDPNSATANQLYAYALAMLGRPKEAHKLLDTVQKIDPYSIETQFFRTLTFFFNGDYPKALESSEKLLQMEPEFWMAHLAKGRSLYHLGQTENAILCLEKASQSGSPYAMACKAYLLAKSGKKPQATFFLNQLLLMKKSAQNGVSPIFIAIAH